jgi:hypothetical protein
MPLSVSGNWALVFTYCGVVTSQTAYEHFKADVNKRKDNVRYFFNYCAKDFAESGNQNFNFKRFALSDEKSFESIFLPVWMCTGAAAHGPMRLILVWGVSCTEQGGAHGVAGPLQEQDGPLRHQGIRAQAGAPASRFVGPLRD